MTRSAILIFLVVISHMSHSQSYVTDTLDINHIRVVVSSIGEISYGESHGTSSVYSSNLWIGGTDPSYNLHVAANTFLQLNTDFHPGPLDTVTSCTYPAIISNWNKVWKINKTTVDSFILGQYSPNIPLSILNWPAHGNISLNQTKFLAPFADVDGDQLYIPANGDYPLIPGDQAIYFLFNDHLLNVPHGSGGAVTGLEIHGLLYAFKCTGDSALDHCAFTKYKIINRSTTPLYDTYVGSWTDLDIGYYNDDYIGFDVSRNTYYAYNGNSNNISASGIALLKGINADIGDNYDNNRDCMIDEAGEDLAFGHFMAYSNDWSIMGNPQADTNYYNYMQSKWIDGSSLTYGGNGYNTGTPCVFAFPDSSDHLYEFGTGGSCQTPAPSQANWNHPQSLLPPSDVRGLATMGPFSLFQGIEKNFEFVYVFGRDFTGSNISNSVTMIQTRIDSIRSYYMGNSTPCGLNFNVNVKDPELCATPLLYPNPTSGLFTLILPHQNAELTLIDITGRIIQDQKVSMGQINLDISHLPDGIYFIKLRSAYLNQTLKVIKRS